MPRIVAFIVAILAVASFADAHRCEPPPAIDVSGTYTSNWGAVTLQQRGMHVTGTYVFDGGRLDGEVDGNLVRFTWTEHAGSGHGVFVVASDGELIGTWGAGNDDVGGGGWKLLPALVQSRAGIGQ